MQAHDPRQDDGAAEAGGRAAQAHRSSTRRRRRTTVTLGLLRAAATTMLLVALYYLLPLDRDSVVYLTVTLVLGLAALVVTAYWEVRAIVRSRFPGIRATQALATLVPFFLILFASTYFMLSVQAPATFSEPLTRSDALYFTVTTFATVGLGDIVPRSEPVRLLVTVQVLLDLVIVGLGIRLILGAVRRGRAKS